MKMSQLIYGLPLLAACFAWTELRADEYHYKDVLIGERASGLGGAYVAISDDPSGIFHNPAGIAFAADNYLSISANAYNTGTQRFLNVFPGKDYTYRNRNFFPSIFGFTQSVGKSKIGIAIMTPVADLIDQDDSISNDANAADVRTLTRRFFRQDTTYQAGPAWAREISSSLSVGISLFGFYRIEKLIDNQLIQIDPSGTNKYYLQNTSLERTQLGVIPKIGVEWMPIAKWSFGLTVSKTYNVEGSGKYKLLASKSTSDNGPVTPTGNFTNDMSLTGSNRVANDVIAPYAFSLGAAYFHSKQFLLTAQVDLYTAEKFPDYPVRAVVNWSIGSEYFASDWLALRLGFFSNNARSRPLAAGGVNQMPHVNLKGSTFSASLFRTNSSVTLGAAYSWGTGQGQAIFNNTTVQTISQTALTIYLSGSYQL